jgi:small-conductance mechanosensitive channel
MVPAVLGLSLLEPTGPLRDLLQILHVPTHLPKDFPQRLATAAVLLVGIVTGLPDVAADPPPTAVLGDIVDGRVKVTTTFHVRDFPQVTPSLDRAREETLKQLAAAGIALAAPQVQVHGRVGEAPGRA